MTLVLVGTASAVGRTSDLVYGMVAIIAVDGVEAVSDRINAQPEIADNFAEVIVSYACTGRAGKPFGGFGRRLPPGHFHFALGLTKAIKFFVLSHEYARVAVGHLESASPQKNILPAADAEALEYSWAQEFVADLRGMVIMLNESNSESSPEGSSPSRLRSWAYACSSTPRS